MGGATDSRGDGAGRGGDLQPSIASRGPFETKRRLLPAALLALGTPAEAAISVTPSVNLAGNAAARADWLALIGKTPAYRLDVETMGCADGLSVSGAVGLGGLTIVGIGQSGGDPKIESGAGSIGGSNLSEASPSNWPTTAAASARTDWC